MKYIISGAAALLAVVAFSPAYALKVTNLDEVTHRVALYGRGESVVREIEPGATEYFTGGSQGLLSLVEAPSAPVKGTKTPAKKQAKRDSVVHADGLLSGIIGNERTSGIPADPDSTYVIWKGGDLRLQSRVKDGRRG
jgi:hypothetical protein